MKILRQLAIATLLSAFAILATPTHAASVSASSTAPAINDADVANYGAVSGTDKWWGTVGGDNDARGQTLATGLGAVRLKAITYQTSTSSIPTKVFKIRVGKISGTSFTQTYTETATQTTNWGANQYVTWTFANPPILDGSSLYGLDVIMVSSTSAYQTGIPYVNVTDNEFAGGARYISTGGGATVALSTGDRIFHLDIETPLGGSFNFVAGNPPDNATGVLIRPEIVGTFSRNLVAGTGNITIRNLTDATDTVLAMNDPAVSISDNLLKIQTAGLISLNKNYAIHLDSSALKDASENFFAGISDDTTWNFATAASDPFLTAVASLKSHINGTVPLDATQIATIFDTIVTNKNRFAESATTISAVFDLVATSDAVRGPSSLLTGGVSFADRTTQPKNLDWTMFQVMQTIMDTIYTPSVLASHEALITGFKLGISANFPGACPAPVAGLTRAVNINASFDDTFGRETQQWSLPARKPTGTYLAPGTVATVTVPAALVNAGYKIRVGCHSWDLEARRTLVKRLDRATVLYPITSATTKIASAYGGGIYIEVPIGSSAGVVNVSVSGAVRSPYFSKKTFHTTTPTEWLTERTYTAPWADFQTDKFMTQVPRKWVYNITDPTAAMTDWDLAMDVINNLMGFPVMRGKETMYGQADAILRSSVHAPGYPAVNNSTNPNNEVSPAGNANNYLVRGPRGASTTASHIEFHEQGHAYFFPKFGGESESTVNLLQPAMLIRAFGINRDVAHRSSLGSNNTNRTMNNTAVAWMTVFNFSPREVPMASGEQAYQHKGHAKWMDCANLFGWDKLDTFWRSYMEDEQNGLPVSEGTDALLLRLCKAVGKDIRPLFHFWGIHPQNPSALAASIAAANPPITASLQIRDQLLAYKALIPANNAAFRTFANAWWGKQPSIGGAWEEREHARQWDTTALYGAGDQQRSEATNPGEIYNENSALDINNRVQELIDLYFPSAITPATMTFAVAPTVVDSTTVGMIATTATAAVGPIEYLFDQTSANPGGTDSAWQTSATYQDSGLTPGLTYTYTVTARDGLGNLNVTSASLAVTPTNSGDITPPAPSPMTFATPPTTVDDESITMTASTAADINGVEYYFENITNSTNSGWQDSPVYTETLLQPLTAYTYRVQARDKSTNQNASVFSANATANTADLPDETPPQIVSVSPADGSLVSNLATNLVVTFDEPINVASGSIVLKNLTDLTETVFDTNDTEVSVGTNTLTLNPPTNLLFGKEYAVQITSGSVIDIVSNAFSGINDDTTWNFTAILADPIVNPGGPYLVPLTNSLTLNGSGSNPSHLQAITTYEWDLNNDGNFGDVTGATPASITDAVLMGTWGMVIGQNTIGLRITDSAAKTATATTTVKIGASLTWDANGTAANQTDGAGTWLGTSQWWESPTNFDWSSGANAIFGSGGTAGAVTLASPTNLTSLSFNTYTGTYTLGSAGQTIVIGSGITKNTGSGAATIISPITLGAAQNWTNNSTTLLTVGPDSIGNGGNLLTIAGTGNTTVSGAIAGAGGLTKSGAGTTTLGNANSYNGITTMSAGVLAIGDNSALGSGFLQLNGGTVQSSDSTARSLSNALSLGGNITVGGTGNITFSDTTASALGATRTITVTNSSVNATFAQSFSGLTFGISKAGAGTLTLGGANSHTGGVTLSGGKLVANGSTALGSGTITMSTASTTLHLQRDTGLTVSNLWSFPTRNFTQTVIVDRQTLGTSENWTISGALAQLSGNTMVFQKGANITNTPSVNLSGGMPTSDSTAGTIRIVGDTVNVRMNNISNTRGRVIELSGSTSANEVYGTITQNNSYACSVTKTGTGTWLLSGNNNGTSVYSNGTTVSNGLLNTTKAAALALYSTAGKVIVNGGTLGVQMSGAGWTTGQVDALLGAATKTNGALGIDTTNANLTQWTAFTTTNLGASLGLSKLGANTLTLDQSNSYNGPTTIHSGTLVITGATQATSAITFAASSSLGLVVGSPVAATSAAVNFANGTVSVSGTPTLASHLLLTASSFAGTPVLTTAMPGYELAVVGTQLVLNQVVTDPYAAWSGGVAFDVDSNNDGVDNGLAFLLGASGPNANAVGLLPIVTQNNGNLVLNFNLRNDRGTATASVQHSSDLGILDPWESALIPSTDSTVNDVVFDITPGATLNAVQATIPISKAASGKLFGKLYVTEN